VDGREISGRVSCLLAHLAYVYCFYFTLERYAELSPFTASLMGCFTFSRRVHLSKNLSDFNGRMLLSAANSCSSFISIPHPMFPRQFHAECDTGNNFISLARRNS
jgi:hypothetical protein